MDEAIESYPRHVHTQPYHFSRSIWKNGQSHFLEKAVPQLMPIIYELNNRVVKKYDDKSVAIIDDEKTCPYGTYGYPLRLQRNGVAYLHTEILKDTELNNFYKIYPEKFNNKTNGITFRRWLLHCDKGIDILNRRTDWTRIQERCNGTGKIRTVCK